MLYSLHAQIIHVYKEANKELDALANFGRDSGSESISTHSTRCLPTSKALVFLIIKELFIGIRFVSLVSCVFI